MTELNTAPQPMADQPPHASDLSKKVSRAARWSLINTIVLRVGSFVIGIILARFFFGPHDFGLYAVGLVVLAVLLSVNEMGVSLAMVRWEGDPRRFAPTVLTLATGSSLFLYLLLFFTAPSVADLLGAPEATTMLRMLCFCLVIDGIACVPIGVLNREFKQGRRAIVDLANVVVSTTVTISLAVAGVGAIAFAWGSLAGNVTAVIGFSIAAPGYLKFGWNSRQARELIRFGLPLAGASLLTLGVLNVDSAVAGGVLGPVALGLYQMAFNISGWPVRLVSETARRVSFAGFSRLAESPQQFGAGFNRAMTLLVSAAMPLCVVLGVLAEPLIRLAYGAQWLPAATALQFLVVLGLLRVAYELAYDCLAASSRRALMAVQGLWLIGLVPVLLILAHPYGIEGVAAGQLVVAVFVVAPALLKALSGVGIGPGSVLRAWMWPSVGGAVMTAVALVLHRFTGDSLLAVLVTAAVATAAYAPFVLPVLRAVRAGNPDPERLALATPIA